MERASRRAMLRNVRGVWSARAMDDRALVGGMVLSLAEFYVVPVPFLALPGLLLFAALAWRRLDRALCLLPLTFPFWYVPKRVIGHVVSPLSEIALAVCLAVALAREAWVVLPPSSSPRRAARQLVLRLLRRAHVAGERIGLWVALGAGLLLLGAAIGVLVARRPHEALRSFRWEIVEPLLYLGLVAAYARGRGAARLLAWAFLASALLVALLADVQVLWLHVVFTPLAQGNRLVSFLDARGHVPRATGILYGDANSLGAWLERALPLALALAVVRRGLGRGERWLALACAVAYVPPLLWSGSRGAEGGAALACVLVLVLAVAIGRVRLVVALALLLAALLAALAFWQRDALLGALVRGHRNSGQQRLLIWLAALHMIRDHPLLGIGPDQFLYYYSGRFTSHPYWVTNLGGRPTTIAQDPTLAHPHDLPLDLWLSVGAVGLAGFTLALGNFWLRCWRLWQRLWRGEAKGGVRGGLAAALALGAGASALAGVVHGLVDSAYFVPDLALAFWWAIALVVVMERRRPAGDLAPQGRQPHL